MAGDGLSGKKTMNYYAGTVKSSWKIFMPQIATHPTWDAWVRQWVFLINAYEGGQEFLRENYLYKHERESTKYFNDRKERAYYLNYVKLVIRLWSTYMKKSPPVREVPGKEFEQFSMNVDLKNNDINEFWLKRVFSLMEAVGMVHIILSDWVPEDVDVGNIRTMRDQKDAGISDRLLIKLPQEMVNWRKKLDGTYKWCVFTNFGIKDLNWDSKRAEEDVEEISYTVYTEDEEIQLDESGKVKQRWSHKLGFVPVVTPMAAVSEQWKDLGVAGMEDVAMINKEVFNISSLIQEFLYRQCFNILAGPEDLLTDEEGAINMGISGVVPYPEGVPPIYVSPPIDPAEFLQKERDKLIQEMYRHSIIRDKAIEKNDPASGIAKAYDVNETTQSLSDKVNALQDAENRVIEMYEKKHNISSKLKTGKRAVEYPKEYDIATINEDLEILTQTFQLNISKTLNQIKAALVARKLLPNASKDEINKIIAEINQGNPADKGLFEQIDLEEKEKKSTKMGNEISQDNNPQ